MGEKRGKKVLAIDAVSQLGKWDFSQARIFFLDLFPMRAEGGMCPSVEVDGRQWVALDARCVRTSSMNLKVLMPLFMANLLL